MHFTPLEMAAEAFLLLPLLALAFFGEQFSRAVTHFSLPVLLGLPVLAAVPYCLVAHSSGNFRWSFLGIYAVLPVILVIILWDASRRDPEQRGGWRDFLVLLILGVVVEFHLFERAWPAGKGSFNRLILLDAALYGFRVVRGLTNVGFHFVPRLSDVKIGLRELAFYAPIAVPLGLFALARSVPIVCPCCSTLACYFCRDCSVGGNLFSRIAAEFAGTPHRAPLGAVGDGSNIWSIAFQ
jgi:hypothetical protein